MDDKAHISVQGLTLRVPTFLQDDRSASSWLSTMLVAAFQPSHREWRTLLSDISFEVASGDRLAVFGRNGAGKSTLLRMLNGAIHPSEGRVEVTGTRQALLNISLGFNAEATVRENVFLRGTAMGLRLSRLHELVPEILAFAGLGDKANHRFKTLSSGQRMRLGFAVSTSVQNDIMLMDEWLGTGDAEFISRAKARMADRVKGSQIVVLASHNVSLLKDVCNKGIVLEAGRMVHFGGIMSAMKHYHHLMSRPAPSSQEVEATLTFGALEEISLADGVMTLRGWAAANGGGVARLAVDVNGRRYLVEDFERMARGDVLRNLGLVDELCGFRARVPVDGLATLSELRGHLQVFGGNGDHLDGPFRVAPSVLALLGE